MKKLKILVKMAMRMPRERLKKKNAYAMTYDSSIHWRVLTRMHGSLWPKVLPLCLFNTTLMVALHILRVMGLANLVISNMGHVYIGVVVSFLLVSRVNTAYSRYNESRNFLSHMYRNIQELVTYLGVMTTTTTIHNDMATTTTRTSTNEDKSSKLWRNEVAYRAILLLRTSMAVIDYPTDYIPAWDVNELTGEEREYMLSCVNNNNDTYLSASSSSLGHDGNSTRRISTPKRLRIYESLELSEFEETMRVPIRVSYMLRKSIHSHSTRLGDKPLHIVEENKLMGFVDNFMIGYYGIRKFLTTPVPFPMVQMSRTFLFAYVFTIPFTFLSDSVLSLVYHMAAVFIITFGFVGLETCAIELDNPFGDDDNDLKCVILVFIYRGWACLLYCFAITMSFLC